MRCLLAAVMLLFACQGLGRTCDSIGRTIQEACFSLDSFAVNLPGRFQNGPMAEVHSKAWIYDCCNTIPQDNGATKQHCSAILERAYNLCRSILAFAPEPKWIIMQIVCCCYAMIGWTVAALSSVIGRLYKVPGLTDTPPLYMLMVKITKHDLYVFKQIILELFSCLVHF